MELSGGTRASAASFLIEPAFAWRDGAIATVRTADRRRRFGREGEAISVGGSEHFALPRLAPGLRDVEVYLGWFGPSSRPMQALSLAAAQLTRVPGGRDGLAALSGRLVRGSSGGPDATARASHRTRVVAEAYDAAGAVLATAGVEGVNAYDFTAGALAWGAEAAAGGAITQTGALGPAEAFGLDALTRGCAEAGISPSRPVA
jgi:hypothetical protein